MAYENPLVERLAFNVLEHKVQYFTESELEMYLEQYESVEEASYYCLLVKAEDTTLSMSGLNVADTSKYFRRQAAKFRQRNTGFLKG